MTSMSHQPHHLSHQQYHQTMTTSSWPPAASHHQVIAAGHHAYTHQPHLNHHHNHHYQSQQQLSIQPEVSAYESITSAAATAAYQQSMESQHSNDNSAPSSAGAELTTGTSTPGSQTQDPLKRLSTPEQAGTPIAAAASDHQQSLSPLYSATQPHAELTPTLKSPTSDQQQQQQRQQHYQTDAIYHNRFFSQAHGGQYYEPQAASTNYAPDQEQHTAISMQAAGRQLHGSGPFANTSAAAAAVAAATAANWPATVNPLASPAGASPPNLAQHNFHHHQHHQQQQQHPQHPQQQQHSHQQLNQQSVSPYSHHGSSQHAAGYSRSNAAAAVAIASVAATNGYGVAQMAPTVHRLHADSPVAAPLHQHFMGQQVAPVAPASSAVMPIASPHNHHQAQQQQQHHHHHHHQQQHHQQQHQHQLAQQHYHQPMAQVQSQHHHQLVEQQQQQFYVQQPAYYQPQQQQQHFHHQQSHHNLRLGNSFTNQQQPRGLPQKPAGQLVAKNYATISPKTARQQQQQSVLSPIESATRGANSLANSPKHPGNLQQQHFQTQPLSIATASSSPQPQVHNLHLGELKGIAGQYCRRQSVSVMSTTSSAASSASGDGQRTGSPPDGRDRSPQVQLGKQQQKIDEQAEEATGRLHSMHTAIQDQRDSKLDQTSGVKEESQLDQLHQQCASLLEDQQRVPPVSTGCTTHLQQQHDDKVVGNRDANSNHLGADGQVQQTTGCNSNNNNNNNNGNPTNVRSKRLRTSFKHNQLKEMKKWFSKNQNPDAKDLKTLAQTTGLSKRVLQVWFQNARAKFRRNNAKANQQLYNVNQHTSHVLQFQQQQPHHHHHQTYGQQLQLGQHNLASHQHTNHHLHHPHPPHQLHGQTPLTTATSTASIVMPTARLQQQHPNQSDPIEHPNQQSAISAALPSAQTHDGTQMVVAASDGSLGSFAQLDIE